MAFQNFALFPHLTAYENVASRSGHAVKAGNPSISASTAWRGSSRSITCSGMRRAKLSNGQKQRTALARALAASPKLLCSMDPLRNVDAKLRFEMRRGIAAAPAHRRFTVLYVTQDYKEAMALGDRIAVIENGRFVQVGTPEEIYAGRRRCRWRGCSAIPPSTWPRRRWRAAEIPRLSAARRSSLDRTTAGYVGREVTLGMRPESMRLVKSGRGLEARSWR